MRYLLDTNVVSNLVRDPQGAVAQHIRAKGDAQVCTSIIVAAELRYGIGKKGSPRLSAQVESVLTALDPDGHFKFLHPWPGQTPPLDGVLLM